MERHCCRDASLLFILSAAGRPTCVEGAKLNVISRMRWTRLGYVHARPTVEQLISVRESLWWRAIMASTSSWGRSGIIRKFLSAI